MARLQDSDVLVVGAGLAGLVAARDLREAGLRVVALEAGHRVGGRTYSAPFPGTRTVVDLGAEWISPRHTALLDEYARYGVKLAPRNDAGTVRWRLDGRVRDGELPLDDADRATVQRLFAALAAEAALLREQGPDAYTPSPGYDDAYAMLLDKLEVEGAAREVVTALGYALMGAFPDEYSASGLVREVAAFGGDPKEAFLEELDRADGGADRLSRLMAAGLDVRFGHAVRAIDATRERVTATLRDGASVTAAAVVLAVPLNVLADVEVTPALPADALAFAGQRHAGRAVKTWLRVDGVPAGDTILSATGPVEAYSISADTGTVLLGAFHLHDDAARVDAAMAEDKLSDFYPSISVHETFAHDWNADPCANGTWLAARPGQWRLQKAFWGPAGRIVFAGGDIAREWAGWMEGAVRSGRAAATETRALLAASASG